MFAFWVNQISFNQSFVQRFFSPFFWSNANSNNVLKTISLFEKQFTLLSCFGRARHFRFLSVLLLLLFIELLCPLELLGNRFFLFFLLFSSFFSFCSFRLFLSPEVPDSSSFAFMVRALFPSHFPFSLASLRTPDRSGLESRLSHLRLVSTIQITLSRWIRRCINS